MSTSFIGIILGSIIIVLILKDPIAVIWKQQHQEKMYEICMQSTTYDQCKEIIFKETIQ